MKIHTIWATENNPAEAWIIDAWDEYSIDNNKEGWDESLKRARHEYPHVRVIVLSVGGAAIMAAFDPPVVSASVERRK
jgi:hypothetical protein